jgi:hypothetical protein
MDPQVASFISYLNNQRLLVDVSCLLYVQRAQFEGWYVQYFYGSVLVLIATFSLTLVFSCCSRSSCKQITFHSQHVNLDLMIDLRLYFDFTPRSQTSLVFTLELYQSAVSVDEIYSNYQHLLHASLLVKLYYTCLCSLIHLLVQLLYGTTVHSCYWSFTVAVCEIG